MGTKLKFKQKLSWRTAVLVTSIAFTVAGLAIITLQLQNPQKAMAATCDFTYVLDWSIPATYTVTCGTVNASNWSVKGGICTYSSPVFNVGGTVGDADKEADISVRINQSGNLDGNDTAWVYMYSNNVVVNTYQCIGGISAAVYTVNLTLRVQAGGTYKIEIKMKNDMSNELWQIKNGDVTSCLRALNPLPITLGGFNASTGNSNTINLDWTTFTEINNDYFTIEHSATGKSFEPITKIPGAGNSNSQQKYSYTDTKPFEGTNYYRLKQTDFDGTTTVSRVIKINIAKTSLVSSKILVYPNPFKNDFSVKFVSETAQDVIIRLVTLDGRVLYSKKQAASAGVNTFFCSPSSQVFSGNYLIQILSNDKIIGTAKAVSK